MKTAVIGTGPTGLYTFQALLRAGGPRHIALFEAGSRLGIGLPWSEETTSRNMLANIASIEIPDLPERYIDWLKRQPDDLLTGFGLDRATVDERDFTPRLLIGNYFADQMQQLIAIGRAAGVTVEVFEGCRVTDITREAPGYSLQTDQAGQLTGFDHVVLATGHHFERDDDLTDHYFPNPWSGLVSVPVPAARVGIMGSSLSAIDAAMVVAVQHGGFSRRDGRLIWQPKAADGLMLTLMSWTGVLPEADFYCPIPWEPLEILTEAAVAEAAAAPDPFNRLWDLFSRQLQAADPEWSARTGLADLTPEGFTQAYFRPREEGDTFAHARRNLAEAERNREARHTIPWRYAILRMHEPLEKAVPAFSKAETTRFNATLKTVFTDNYAAVPPLSIERVLALYDAGVLEILALGEDYQLTHHDGHSEVLAKGKTHRFDVFIDACGQRPQTSKDLPFPSLALALQKAGQDAPELSDSFALQGVPGYEGIFFGALPFLMEDQPFVQGLTSCARNGATIAGAIIRDAEALSPRSRPASTR
ncbi:FAD/NAD(P)-binding protein [Falsigemmobacter faecalis]|uniref:FAD-NAD(P)-binding protein n=1 Tax=Falsigemmobacter faecalis TaxID=2488730 RepID=A0A3P3DWT9_9RHOB|nr:FAD/NAD(P)-binding protein [Falsigemmobacter faecalis]RRH78226.1 FAD-NAD(P)-binding protein [Falsigemmobacter faecalis]